MSKGGVGGGILSYINIMIIPISILYIFHTTTPQS